MINQHTNRHFLKLSTLIIVEFVVAMCARRVESLRFAIKSRTNMWNGRAVVYDFRRVFVLSNFQRGINSVPQRR